MVRQTEDGQSRNIDLNSESSQDEILLLHTRGVMSKIFGLLVIELSGGNKAE
jgi:hypothetical protein